MKYTSTPLMTRYIFLVTCVVSCAFLQHSCNSSEDPEVFPRRYKYDHLDFLNTQFVVLTSNYYTNIPPTGYYSAYNPLLADLLDIEVTEFEIEEVELVDAQTARIYFFSTISPALTDTIIPYERTGDIVTLFIGGSVITLEVDDNTLRYPLYSIQHSKNLGPNDVDYSPIDIFHDALSLLTYNGDMLNQRRTQFDLHAGDTVAINKSAYVFLLQE